MTTIIAAAKIIIKKTMTSAIIIYLLLLVFLFLFQRRLQYMPMGKMWEIAAYNLEGFEEKRLTTSDKIKIYAWYKPAKKDEKIILYFHGNAGNMGDRAHKFSAFANRGFGVLAISYRGYYGSEGSPSEVGLMRDADAALQFLLEQDYQVENIILFGESLGSGVVVQMATKFNFAAVILESPYSSIAGVAQKKYWYAPVGLLLKDKFESIKFISKISKPVLIFHGTADKIVPYQEGKKLFDAANMPKKLITVEGAGHLNFSDEFLLEEMKKFLKKKGEWKMRGSIDLTRSNDNRKSE